MGLNDRQTAGNRPKIDYSEVKSLDLWQMLERTAQLYPEREALVSGSHRYTFQQVQAMALRCAAGLYQNGLRQGDRLGLIMPNWTEFVVAYFAAARLGAVLVPLNVR